MIEAKVLGIPEFKRALSELPSKIRKQALMNALRAGGRVVRDAVRQAAPLLNANDNAVRKGWRKPGTLKQAVSVRTSRRDSKAKNAGVFINVKPLKKGQGGAKNPNDPYYWRWIYDGWNPAGGSKSRIAARHRRMIRQQARPKKISGNKFLDAGGRVLTQALKAFTEKLGPAIQKLNNRVPK